MAPSDDAARGGRPPFLDAPTPSWSTWFDAPSREDWARAAASVLKGRPLDSLQVKLPGGVVVEPFPEGIASDPGPMEAAPWVRAGGDRVAVGWDVRALLDEGDAGTIAQQAAHALSLGARSLQIVVGDGAAELGPDGLGEALAAVDPGSVPVDLDVGDPAPWRNALLAWAGSQAGRATGALAMDPLADAVAGCPWDEARWDALAGHLAALEPLPWVHGLSVGALAAEARGADGVLSTALALATLAEAVRALAARGWAAEALVPRVILRMAATQDVFVGIARVRALRGASARVLHALGVPEDRVRVWIHTTTHPGEEAAVEPWTNVLRATGGVVGAALGGADAVTVRPRDALAGGSEAGRRLALTGQAVLALESHLGAVADPAGGSRHVEQLTDRIGRAAWAVLQTIEAAGGLSAWSRGGGLDEALERARAETVRRVGTRRDGVVGVSRYARPDADVLAPRPDGAFRRAAPYESLRERVAALSVPPRVLLVTIGPVGRHKARAGFAADWFAAVGLHAVEVPEDQLHDAPEAAAACLCGHDDDYPEAVPRLLSDLSTLRWRMLAGRPGAHEADWRAAGLDDALFLGADALAGLTRLVDALEVSR